MAKKKKPAKNTAIGGPFVIVAAVVERSLQEKDNSMSLIRLFDRLNVELPKEEGEHKLRVPISFVLMFKSGDFVGNKSLEVTVVDPDGSRNPFRQHSEEPISLTFEGQEVGPTALLQFELDVSQEGLHWFEVALSGKMMTKTALRVVHDQPSKSEPAKKKKT
jgi:hypothetical protein